MKKILYTMMIASIIILCACNNSNQPSIVKPTSSIEDLRIAEQIDTTCQVFPMDYFGIVDIVWDSVGYYAEYGGDFIGDTSWYVIAYICDEITMDCLLEYANMYEDNTGRYKRQLYIDMMNSFIICERDGHYRLLYCPEYFE